MNTKQPNEDQETGNICIFCRNLPKLLENDLAYCLYDIKPITKGHMLVITKRHHTTIFESTPEEIKAVFELIHRAKEMLFKEHNPDGFNIVANCGEAAGQIVLHAHMHILPRYKDQPVNPLNKKADFLI